MVIGFDASRAFISQKTGTENYSYNLICALAKIDKKNKYKLYLRNFQFPISNFQFPPNFSFVRIPLPRFWTQVGLAWECFLHPPDVLFIPAHTLPILRRPSLKTVVTIHDLGAQFLPTYYTFPQKFYLTWSTKYAVKKASAIIAVSVATKNDLVTKLGADPGKIFVVYEGIDKNKFKTQNLKLKTEKILEKYKIKKPYILFVGTIQPRKNLERLIQAFRKLTQNSRQRRGEPAAAKLKTQNLNLVIAGKFGWLYDEILAAPKKFKVENQVKFLNYVPDSDLPAIYSASEALVIPSLVEGFGLPVLEGMAAKIPVISSAASSLPEVGGEAAVYFNPEDPADLAEKIARIIADNKLRQNLITKGLRQVRKFSWEKTARDTLEVLESVYENRNFRS